MTAGHSSEIPTVIDLFKDEDYSLLHAHLQLYKSQLLQCEKDIERLRILKEEAFDDPWSFIQAISARSMESISRPPQVDTDRYQKSLANLISSRRNRLLSGDSATQSLTVGQILARLSELQKSFTSELDSPNEWTSILELTEKFPPSSSVLELKKHKETLAQFKVDDPSIFKKQTSPAFSQQKKMKGYVLTKNRALLKKKKLSLYARGRGRPPGLMKRPPWSEAESNEADMKKGYYEDIHKKLRNRPPSEIREKVQVLLNEDLALFDSDADDMEARLLEDDPIYDD